MNMKMKRKMNTRKKKALSPVVASIILIAVTVAVSIAVAAWMGALTFSFTNTEQVNITSMTFVVGAPGKIVMIANNTGTSPVTINTLVVNNNNPTSVDTYVGPAATHYNLPVSIPANQGCQFNVTMTITNGANYQLKMTSSKGNSFIYTATAPS
jgi:flagellin-like protein